MTPKSEEDILKSFSHLSPKEILFKGVGHGILKLVQYAVENGADVNVNIEDKIKWTPLTYAVVNNDDEDIIKYLIDNGAIVTNKTIDAAYNKGNYSLIKMLKKYLK